MEIFLIKLLQFLLAISLLVLLHELGHFTFAKIFHVRVDKFYLFFNPWFHLFEWKPKNSETTYGIGWLPLGGYCSIAGMVDETNLDEEKLKTPPQPWEFRSKPAWQRLLIMIGGVLVNFLLALFIYSMILFHWGESYIKVADMTQGMKFSEQAKAMGFQDHDILLGTDEGTFKDFSADVYRDIVSAKTVYVKRGDKTIGIPIKEKLNLLDMLKSTPQFVRPFAPSEVDSVLPHSVAERMGLKKGDKIIAVNGVRIDSSNDFFNELGRVTDEYSAATTDADRKAARAIQLLYYSTESKKYYRATSHLDSNLKLGFTFTNPIADYHVTNVNYSFFESIPAGIKYGWNTLAGYVSDLRYIFSKEGAKSLGGFGTIGNLFPSVWDWHAFWEMTAFLSIILAFMNILPIPALDGGHVLFLLYEMITGRKPSDKFMIYAEYIGIFILFALMIVANLNDILRWIGLM